MTSEAAVSWNARELARVKMLRLRAQAEEHFDVVLECALGICSTTLDVSRVGLWFFEEGSSRIVLRSIVDRDDCAARGGAAITVREIASYERELQAHRYVAVADVRRDPLLSDVYSSYYAPLGVASTLDAPIYRDGAIVGVVCVENRNTVREWKRDEAEFVMAVADILSQLLLASSLREAEEELRDLESKLTEARFAESLVRVARGISHDINGLLTVILTNVTLLERSGDDASVRARCASEIREVARGGSRLAKTLMTYGTPNQGTLRKLGIDDALAASKGVWASVARARRLEFIPAATDARAFVDPAFLDQILLNLVTNAVEATSDGGKITVRTQRVEPRRFDARGEILIEVSDDGKGMDEMTRVRCLEPFYSTKGEPQRGLGLSTVSGLVRSAGGKLEVESKLGEGTTFRVRLPLVG